MHQRVLLFFCSSAGEYEQAVPLIERSQRMPSTYVHVVLHSPSGMDHLTMKKVAHTYSLAPVDSYQRWLRILAILRPDAVFVIRNEYWPGFFAAAREYSRLIIVDVTPSLGGRVKQWIKKIFLSAADQVYTVREHGDTKYDRVLERVGVERPFFEQLRNALVQRFGSPQRLIIGSAWPEDLEMVLRAWPIFIAKQETPWQVLVVPHDISEVSLRRLESICHRASVSVSRWSRYQGEGTASPDFLIVDTLGRLAEWYGCAQLAIVGGGFGKGVHNILEAAAYGLAIAFGPKYQDQVEAELFVQQGLAAPVRSAQELVAWWNRVGIAENNGRTRTFLTNFAGASDHILKTFETPDPNTLAVLHVNLEKGWRGGENQLRLLLKFLPQGAVSSHLLLREGHEAQKRMGAGFPCCTWETGLFGMLFSISLACFHCRMHGITLIHAHGSKAHTVALTLASFRKDLKIIVHRRVDDIPSRSLYHRWKYASPKIVRYIAVSQAVKRVLQSMGVREETIEVIMSSLDNQNIPVDRLTARRNLSLTTSVLEDAIWITNAGAMTKQKDQATLLMAFAKLHRMGMNAILMVAGEGPLQMRLERLCQELGIESRVHFLGQLDSLDQLLAASDIFALSSIREGLGTVLLEAAARGCALIATDAGGVCEFIRHQETGLLVPQGDAEALADGILWLHENPEAASTMKVNARKLLLEKFSAQLMAEKALQVYRESSLSATPAQVSTQRKPMYT
ncbi:glycosyltransferase [Oligoflexus tunisiensis]|uniref:glycosyltransferase n=1 Tax=Oligoflexus tunisiensis TaxID=708132 RepID=UPI00159F309C|nr:glycosyltransferase [Oligoflexus tunisiensis]